MAVQRRRLIRPQGEQRFPAQPLLIAIHRKHQHIHWLMRDRSLFASV